jgi:head-tail adaptor
MQRGRGYVVDRVCAGRRDRLITIEQRSTAEVDAADPESGEPVETWTTLVEQLPAHRDDVQGFERLRATRNEAVNEVRWEIAYRADMDPELVDVATLRRLVFQARTFDIKGASQIGRRRGIELYAVASTRVEA